ncbi:peptidoglycan-N-acetylglucosamine deacetylase [Oxobacter pfennigii]|uniref:Peptidoglycan-N-acetylglucosamine deacetylase n=1 Tax=Oxobacter pfennigii TaxID=36849 RepID=A0A0P8WDW3_9CLOT|nr:polysaccharide deacetylase family protein [Oxobacter pfennigii]KPU46257.1 peptidoglycan-N-acetylglucosamine deacetylase [Oxobacter pfennigii]
MYKYRLTRRGKIVFTVLAVIIFSATSALAMGMMNNSADNKITENKPINTYSTSGDSKEIFVSDETSGKTSTKVFANISDADLEYGTNVDNSGQLVNFINADAAQAAEIEDDILRIDVENALLNDGKKVVFLTFDDGPSNNITPQILKILDEYDVHATFFVLGFLGVKNTEVLKGIKDAGHAIGVHTYSHNYKKVYADEKSFRDEVDMSEDVLKEVLGEDFKTRLFRFPGGSFEPKKKTFMKVLDEYGYVSIDWNTITGDGESSSIGPQRQLQRLIDTSENREDIIILMHDSATKQTTADALPGIIEYLKSKDYEFAILK